MKITKVFVRKFEDGNGLKGFADVVLSDNLLLKGMTIREGQYGLFVSMPAKKLKNPYENKDGEKVEYQQHFHPITKEFNIQLQKTVLEEFENTDDEGEDDTFEEDDGVPF